ncbi:glutathione S-transferase family protein [Dongia deserti]|uniref:glutathione S-transferase family protein n=1 Tax=Dongia deserti TaxID=2268030 RepID=UPI0013C43B4D|nr:glutathione S-transferase [Dongia deserti]
MYKLYWSPGSAAMAPHAMLEDIGVPYELVRVDTAKGEQHSRDYLKLNPHARVPTLIYDGDKVMYESAAICLLLAERHPEAGFAPEIGSADRAPFLQWMAYLTNTVQEALMHWWHAEHFVDGVDLQAAVKHKAERRVADMFRFLDEQLAKSGPYLCGAKLYACDYYAVMLARWTRAMAAPVHTNPQINTLIRAVMARPGYARMLKAEGIEQLV